MSYPTHVKFDGQILPVLPSGFSLQTYGQVQVTSYEPTTGKLFQIINFTGDVNSFVWHTSSLTKPGGANIKNYPTTDVWVFPDHNIDTIGDLINYRFRKIKWIVYELGVDGRLVLRNNTDYGIYGLFNDSNIAKVKVASTEQYLSISNRDMARFSTLLNSTALQTEFINTLIAQVNYTNFTGVEVSFEAYGAWTLDQWNKFKPFMNNLGLALNGINKKLIVEGPAIWNALSQSWFEWKYEELNSLAIDYILPKLYDYQFDYANGSANAPYTFMVDSINYIKGKFTNHTKLVWGLPSAGYEGVVDEYLSTNLTYQRATTITGFNTATRMVDSGEMKFQVGNIVYVYLDDTSHDLKRAAINNLIGTNGVSYWHFGENKYGNAFSTISSDSFYQSFSTKNFKIEKGINYNSKWTPHKSESHHCVVQYIGNDVQFYNKGNVYLNGSRTFINRIAPNVDTVYVQGNKSKFIPVIKNCITPYLYYRGNGLGILNVRGNVINVNRVEKEYLNFNNKKIPFKTINKTLKRLNTGFDLNETEVFNMINSGYLFELNLNNVNLVRDSEINATTTAYGAQIREMYLVKGRKYVFSVTARKTAPELYDGFSIIYDNKYVEVSGTSWMYFDYPKSTPFQVFTAPYSGIYRILSYSTANRPLYIWNYSVTEGDKLIPYTSGQLSTSDFEPFKLNTKPYVINNSESDGYVGKNLSEKNVEIEIESIEDSEQMINTQINFFD